jgi:hypothetical protein
MSKRDRVDALTRLNQLTGQLEDIVNFLLEEKLITDSQLKSVKFSADRAKEVELILNLLQKSGSIQLLEYKWVILPTETINIYIVTDKNYKNFYYGESA